jgi:enoyl-CoA hydratase
MADPYEAYEYLLTDRPAAHVLRLTLNNPERLNAVTPPMHKELARVWRDIASDTETRVVLLTGAGKAFSAGGDLGNMQSTWRQRDLGDRTVDTRAIFLGMLELPQPVVTLLNGDAVGLGATIALSGDMVIAAERARIGDRHVNVGLAAGDGGALLWPLILGPHRAKELLFTGRLVPAPEALAMGILNQVVPLAELEQVGLELASKLVALSPLALQWTKLAVNRTLSFLANGSFEVSLAWERATMLTEDHHEAVTALLEKREPSFNRR